LVDGLGIGFGGGNGVTQFLRRCRKYIPYLRQEHNINCTLTIGNSILRKLLKAVGGALISQVQANQFTSETV